jgi:hypothetical protein
MGVLLERGAVTTTRVGRTSLPALLRLVQRKNWGGIYEIDI